ncbi:major facilitator superfamily domain-containing protein [Xylariales sp. PMI_506]|nr:major facilitator superfamily domain-containing protein [Xylariales sp. PMI_506]
MSAVGTRNVTSLSLPSSEAQDSRVVSIEDLESSPEKNEDSDLNEYPEGGGRAWLVAAGSAGVLFSTMGYTNSFGVFEAYYKAQLLQGETADRISWIGALQSFLMFAAGSVGGPLFDRYGAMIIRPAALVYVFAVMMTSLCHEYWQLMLAQGVLTGFSSGLLIFPAMTSVSQYFSKKRAAAMGLVVAGSSIGAVVFPLALSKMLNSSSLGFGWTVRISAFIMLPILGFSCAAISARLPPRTSTFFIWSAFRNTSFILLILAVFCIFIGMITPLFYLPTYAIEKGMDATLASYLVAVLNGASTFGRIIPGILADRVGRLNMLFAAALATGIIVLCWTTVTNTAGLVVYAVFFGFSSGAIVSGSSTAFTICPEDPRDIGTYMGMGMAIGSIATLIGPPSDGALLTRYGGFLQVSIFSGVMSLVGALFILATKATTAKGAFGRV